MTQKLLQELTSAYGPVGQEDEIRDLVHEKIKNLCDEVWVDSAGNLIGKTLGQDSNPKKAIKILTHLDEISLIISHIDRDGKIFVAPLGGTNAYSFGQGPVDILGEKETISGVLSIGSMHNNDHDSDVWKIKPEGGNQALDLKKMYVITGFDQVELEQRGVFVSSRVVVAKSRRNLTVLGNDLVGSYFMDDRAAVAAALLTLMEMQQIKAKPLMDIYWIFSVAEELGGVGAAYAQKEIPGYLSLALEVAPAEQNFGIKFNSQPVVVYHDTWSNYDKETSDKLIQTGQNLGLKVQRAVYSDFGSDASVAKRYGHIAKSSVISIPTLNTHGYETLHLKGIENLSQLLINFITN